MTQDYSKYAVAATKDKEHSKDQVADGKGNMETKGVGRPAGDVQKKITIYVSIDNDRRIRAFTKKFFKNNLSSFGEKAFLYFMKKWEESDHPFFS